MEQQELDTFDDGAYTDGPMDDVAGAETQEASSDGQETPQEGQSTEEVSDQAKSGEEIDKDSQVNLLDNSEEKAEEKDAAGDEGAGEKDPEPTEAAAKPDGKDETGENAGDSEEKVRNLKAFRNGKQYEVPEDAEVKVKVKGKWEKVPLTDLRDNYAGKVAYDEKFSELNSQVKEFEVKETQYNQELDGIRGHLGKIADLTKAAYEGKVSPTQGMEYLLDLMGANSLEYRKATFENMAEEFLTYAEMSELERDAYWTKQENEFLTKRQESLTKKQTEEKTRADFQKNVSELREAHGISEDDYDSAAEDLKLGGAPQESITPEEIVRAARLKPLMLEADRLMEPYREQLSDAEFSAMSVEIATTMFQAPELPIADIKKLLAEQYEVDAIVDTLVEKTGTSSQAPAGGKQNATQALESFDDFDSF